MTLIKLSILYIALVAGAYFGGTAFEHVFGLGSVSTVFMIFLGMFVLWFFARALKDANRDY